MGLRIWFLFFACCAGGCRAPNADVDSDQGLQLQNITAYLPELGKGVDAAETRTFAQCVKFDDVVDRPLAFSSRLYDERMIKTRRDLDESLGVDVHVKASGLWGKTSAGASYFKNVALNSDSVFWMVNARYETQSESLNMKTPGFDLTPMAKRLLKEQGIEAFTAACGTHFYSGRVMGGRYSLLYEFKAKEEKVLETIKSSASYEGFGLGMDAEFTKAIQAALRTSSLTIHSDSEGGGHEVADVATDPAELKNLLSVLRRDLASNRQGKPLLWEATPYTLFPEVAAATSPDDYGRLLNDFKRVSIKNYYNRYMDNQDRIATIESLLERAHRPRPLMFYTPEHEQDLRALADQLRAQNDTLAAKAATCFESDSGCSAEQAARIESSATLLPDDDMSGFGTWTVRTQKRRGPNGEVDFWADSLRDGCPPRIFETRLLYESPFSGTFFLGYQNNWRGPVAIGPGGHVHDERGKLRPDLCLGEYSGNCNLRIITLPNQTNIDGCAAAIMELTIYNRDGSISQAHEFSSYPASHLEAAP